MKNLISKAAALLIVCVFITSLIITGCKDDKDDADTHGKAPALPPQSSFVMDFSGFEKKQEKSAKDTMQYTNRNWAVANVLVWSAILNVTLAVPVASFKEAFKHEAVWQSDSSWLWSYNVWSGNNIYTAKLYGKVKELEINWKMYVSKTGANPFTDFLWYTGVSNINGAQGTWTLYKSPDENVTFIGIEWHKNSDGTSDIKYTNIIPGDKENGGYISYGLTKDTPYNAYYNIYSKSLDNLTDIRWHLTNKNGQVKDPHYFSNADWHCWDTTGKNTTCP